MEGVMDAPMRAVLAEIGGFDFAVSEFIRVSQQALKARAIAHKVPELTGAALGRATLPIQVQLLGSSPELLAATALEACVAGARAIDLNFGCPSPTVIRRQGGSALLRKPAEIQKIVAAVRSALPAIVPVSAKIRLGWEKPEEVHAIAQAAVDGGANWLVIHARTKGELYRPGVHWEPVREVADRLPIPVVANGDIFSVEEFKKCRAATGCRHFMLGRGILADPFLAQKISRELKMDRGPSLLHAAEGTESLLTAIRRFVEIVEPHAPNSGYLPSRIKQWVRSAHTINPDRIPKPLLTAVGRARTTTDILAILA